MAVGPAAFLSFVNVTFLAVFIPVQRIRTNVPRLAIILWLLGFNLVHGINALVWSGNVDIHVPVWCDIVTKLMLGANLALPAAFFCVSLQLELLSSMRTISSHPTVVRNRLMSEIFMCYLLPILYMLLHLVVQDHRFDIVENLGCSASIDPSTVGYTLMWIPPLLICSISIIFFVLSIRNSSRHGSSRFIVHLESRSTMTSSSFYHCLVVSMATTIAAGLVYLFCSFYGPVLHPWSWTSVHASMSEVNIVSSQIDVETIQVAWWGGFVVSSLYLLLSFCLGEETRDIFQWIRQQVTRERRFILPIHIQRNAPFSLPKMTQPPWSRTRPISVDHKSGWDDMLDVKVPKAKKGTGKTSAMVVSTCSSPTPTITTVVTEDEVFMTSTLSYLSSPTATTLGLSGPSVPRKVVELPPKPRISPPLSPTLLKATDNLVPTSPISPLPGLPASCYASRPRSHSLTSRSEETNVQASLHNCPTESPTASPKRPVLTSPSTRSLQSTWSRETLGHDRGV